MREQNVDGARLRQIVQRNTAGARQIDLVEAIVIKIVRPELAHSVPFEVQGEHSALGKVDAADLNIRRRDAGRLMAVDVQYYRHFAAELFGLIEQGWDPQAGDRLVSEFPDAVSRPGQR